MALNRLWVLFDILLPLNNRNLIENKIEARKKHQLGQRVCRTGAALSEVLEVVTRLGKTSVTQLKFGRVQSGSSPTLPLYTYAILFWFYF